MSHYIQLQNYLKMESKENNGAHCTKGQAIFVGKKLSVLEITQPQEWGVGLLREKKDDDKAILFLNLILSGDAIND